MFGAPRIKRLRKLALWSSPPGRDPNCGIPMKSDVIFKHILLIVFFYESIM